jgi:hypothetical protein
VSGTFTFTWKVGGKEVDKASFSLKKIISAVDYDLLIP